MFLNLTNHPSALWSAEETAAARRYGEIRDLPFPNVPPDTDEAGVDEMARALCGEVKALKPGAVMCQGEMTLTFRLVLLLKAAGIKVLAACSERVTTERKNPDGSTEKTAVFVFRRFREY